MVNESGQRGRARLPALQRKGLILNRGQRRRKLETGNNEGEAEAGRSNFEPPDERIRML